MAAEPRIFTKARLEELWANGLAEHAAREACKGHDFSFIDPANKLRGKRCLNCGARFRLGEAAIYLQGLEHGKKFGAECTCNPLANTGGGHSRDCPEYEPECTCYERGHHNGHEPGCPLRARP